MGYQVFKEKVKEKLLSNLNGTVTIEEKEVRKNNDVVFNTIMINSKEERVSPCIFLDTCYEQYLEGRTIESIIQELVKVYENASNQVSNLDLSKLLILNFETVKEKIYLKVVNAEMNKELLTTVPHKKFLDLAIVYCYLCEDWQSGMGSIVIRNEFFDMWNCDLTELHEIALANTMKLFPATIHSMEEVLAELIGEGFNAVENSKSSQCMYVMSNTKGINGASTLLYPNIFKKFIEKLPCDVDSILILPSSVHESATRFAA